MAKILFNEATKEFHLQNERISYIFCILENGQLGHLYFGNIQNHSDFYLQSARDSFPYDYCDAVKKTDRTMKILYPQSPAFF